MLLKVWRVESMAFILASCRRRAIRTDPPAAKALPDGSFEVALLCDRRLADEVRAEFNSRPIQACGRRKD